MPTTRVLRADSIEGIAYVKDYIKNGRAHRNTSLWNGYLDSGSRPVDGTGGSPSANLTWTVSTSSPLSDTSSFLLSKINGVSTQGQGFSYDYTIDSADQARVLQISGDYEIVSGTYSGGTSSTDSDIIIYCYRTTATGRLIEPSVIKLDGSVVGVKYSFRSEFQTDSDATGYRFIIHTATSTTQNFVIKFDNISISRSRNVNGAIVTAWTAIPAASMSSDLTTNTTLSGRRRRVGDVEYYECFISFTGNNTQSNAGDFSILDRTFDTSKLFASTANLTLGTATLVDAASNQYPGYVRYINTNTVRAAVINTGTNPGIITQFNPSTNTPISFTNGDIIAMKFSVPIAGWGATATLGQDADTRVVACKLSVPSNQTISATSAQVDFSNIIVDTHGGADTANDRYRIPVSGVYRISTGILGSGVTSGTLVQVDIRVNGTTRCTRWDFAGASTEICVNAEEIFNLNAGDLITLQVGSTDSSWTLSGGAENASSLSINRISGPSQIAATEQIVFSAAPSTPTATIGSAYSDVTSWGTPVVNTHGSSLSSGIYTVLATGNYFISTQMMMNATYALGNTVGAAIVLDGSTAIAEDLDIAAGAESTITVQCHTIRRLNAGQTLKVQVRNAGTTPTFASGTERHHFIIERRGGFG